MTRADKIGGPSWSKNIPIWIGRCCREWPMAGTAQYRGRCGICGEVPEFVRWENIDD